MDASTHKLFQRLCVVVTLMLWAATALLHAPYDFDVYYYGGLLQRHGVTYTDPSQVVELAHSFFRIVPLEGVYGAPSLIALVYEPISFLQRDLANVIWFVAVAALFGYAIMRATGSKWHIWFVIAGISPAILEAVWLGNHSVVTFCLILLTYAEVRHGNNHRAGIYLAIAAAFKIYPGVLLLVFIVKRDWRAVKWFVATFAVITAATLLVLGPQQFHTAYRALVDVGSGVNLSTQNNSIPGLLRNYVDLDTARYVAMSLLAAYAVVVWLFRKIATTALLAVAAAMLLLAQPVSWHMYFSVTLLAAIELSHQRNKSLAPWWPAIGLYALAGGALMPLFRHHDWTTLVSTVEAAASVALICLVLAGAKRGTQQLDSEPDQHDIANIEQ